MGHTTQCIGARGGRVSAHCTGACMGGGQCTIACTLHRSLCGEGADTLNRRLFDGEGRIAHCTCAYIGGGGIRTYPAFHRWGFTRSTIVCGHDLLPNAEGQRWG
jgi:hypothetical protein